MDVDQNRAEQVRLYGAPLGELLSRYAGALGVSQGQLAAVLGVSAPMLSQLMNARRVRIGNPAAVRQLQAMHDAVADVESGQWGAPEALEFLQSVKDGGGDVFTKTTATRPQDVAGATRGLLQSLVDPGEYERAAHLLDADYPEVARVLRAFGGHDEVLARNLAARAGHEAPPPG